MNFTKRIISVILLSFIFAVLLAPLTGLSAIDIVDGAGTLGRVEYDGSGSDAPQTEIPSEFYGLLIDEVGVLDADEEKELLELLESVGRKHSCTVAVAFLNSFSGSDIARFAADYYEEKNCGIGSDRDGVLLTVVLGTTGKWDIRTHGMCDSAYDESALDEFEDRVITQIRNRDYKKAVEEYASVCDSVFEEYKKFPLGTVLGISLVFGFIIAIVTVSAMKGKLKTIRRKNNAADYVKKDSLNIKESRDIYLYSNVTRVAKPKESSSGSSGGRTSSSSGGSYGGRSGSI